MDEIIRKLNLFASQRAAYLGLGNPADGDDGLGLRLAEQLQTAGLKHVIIAGTQPERYVLSGDLEGFAHVVFLDAVDCGMAPGSTVLLDRLEMASRYPQVSTHKLSLGLLAGWIERQGNTRAWLLGVQPATVRPGCGLTPVVLGTINLLAELLSIPCPMVNRAGKLVEALAS